jgi:putative inorganic carbon (hco3(-)) transporter
MATTVGHSAAEPRRPIIVGFSRAPFSLPVRSGELLRWVLIVLFVANLGRIPVLGTGDREASIVLNDLCVSALVAFCLIGAVLRRSLKLDAVAVSALAFAFVGFASAVLAVPRFGLTPFELFVSLSYLIRWLTYFGVFLFVINNVRLGEVSDIWDMLVRVMLAFSVFGIFQSAFLPGFAQMVYPESRAYLDWDPQGHRLVSTILEPNIAASMIVIVLLIQLAQISLGAKVPVWKPVVFLFALALTLSRSGFLALIAGLAVILIVRGISVRLMKLFGAILFLSIAIIPRLIAFAQLYGKFETGEGTSAGTRVLAWLLALEAIGEHPVIGVGFNTYGYYKASKGMTLLGASSYGSDGGLLFATVMTGVVGLVCYLLMLAFVLRRSRVVWRDVSLSPEHRGLAIGVAAGVVAIMVHSLFVNSMFTTFVMEMMWVTWGLVFVIARGRTIGHSLA